ncbi:MAG: transcriptional regulator [Oscillospiraceae bacterium]|nr:transcriptional regulator [Oscillospiraceae bacterium]
MYIAESKKLALLRIYQILRENSDCDHPMTQEEIAEKLSGIYGIEIERKAIGRNISLLKEAGFEIESNKHGSYLAVRTFDDSELRMLIDGVLSSKHITAKHSADLIERLCGLSNKYFRSHVKYVHSVNDWSKTDNQALFLNIELISEAIEKHVQIQYEYNKYGVDKKLHKSSFARVSPYQLILHNQRYYLMAYNEYWAHMVFHRLDRMTKMAITEKKVFPLKSVKGFENGMDFKKISSAMPYMFTENFDEIEFLADAGIVDQIYDWFGNGADMTDTGDGKVRVKVYASTAAVEYWAMQYLNFVEVTSPASLREKLRENVSNAAEKYNK